MPIILPGDPDARFDAASLHKVLRYSDQHRVVICRALKKAFPEQWPEGRLAEDAFYEALFRLLEKPASCAEVFRALYLLAQRKHKANWWEVLNPLARITGQACHSVSISNAEEVRAALAVEDMTGVWNLLAEQGHPEFLWWYRWVQRSLEGDADSTEDADAEVRPASPEAVAEEWRAALEELHQRAAEAAGAPPSEDLVGWLKGAMERLAELARRYAELTNLSGIVDRCIEALDHLDAAGPPEVAVMTSRAREALAGTAGPRQRLEDWAERLQAKGEALREVQAREAGHREAAKSALDRGAYEEGAQHSQQAASARRELGALLNALAALVEELEAFCSSGGEQEREVTNAPIEDSSDRMKARGELAPPKLTEEETAPVKDPQSPGSHHGEEVTAPPPTGRETRRQEKQGHQVEEEARRSSTRFFNEEPPEDGRQKEGAASRVDLPQWGAQVSVQALSEEVVRHEGAQRVQSARALVWALVRDGQLPLAYHLARAVAEVSPPGPGDIRAEPLRAVHLGGYLSSGAGEEVVELGETLRRFYEVDLADGALRGQRALALLTFAAVLRPAMVAPHASGAQDLLRGLPLDDRLSALHALREQILAPDLRFQAMLHLEPGGHLDELRSRSREWWEANRRHNFKYEPATWVWRHLLEKGQALGSALSVIVDGGPAELAEAQEALSGLQSRGWIEKMIRQADQAVRERKAIKKPIEAGPLTDMVKRSAELAGLLSEWVEAIGEQAARAPGREAALRADKLRLLGNLDRALAQADSLRQTAELAEGAAAACVVAVLRDVRARLEGKSAGRSAHSGWWRTLNGVLLPSDTVVLAGDRWEPELGADVEPLVVLAGLVNPPDWEVCFDAANKGCDHIRTAQILDWLRYEGEAEGFLDLLERRREDGLRRCRHALEADLDSARDAVERAASLGYLGEDDRSRLVASLDAASAHNREREDLHRASARVQEVLGELARLRDRQVIEIRQRIEASNVAQTDPEALQRISELLEAGDILTASEYVALLEDGQSIPGPAERRDPFKDEFFPEFVERLPKELSSWASRLRDVPQEIARGGQVGPVNMRHVPGAQARSAGEMLHAWQLLKARRGDIAEHLKAFLERLGFSAVEVMRVKEGGLDEREQVFDATTRPLADRDICVVPRYGSHAGGQYRVLCVWERPSEEEVLASPQAYGGGRAVIILYLGQLSVKRRRDLAFRSRDRNQTVLVIDETLVYFLCAERGSRLATLFDCALPFTVAKPYVTTSSDVPTELFFGRRRELEDVFDQAGTNLVYGGRQLGKTALLRAVVRRFHSPKRGVIIAWVDLKERHIGLSEPADAVWQVIDRELVQREVLPNARRSPEGTADAVTRWLDASRERRIVMLLDEADAFLAQDARDAGFRTVGTLKGLMERTGRRFKVVFAGLHNVQRTSRDVNSPLAHFGNPVCIGPLLANGEAREAYQLVERPLRQLGFRFESPSLVNRVLAQTNYYPNLIQIFCAHLLKYLHEIGSARFDPATTLPYVITREHVEAVSQSRDLQQTIRSRFQITLDLDNRYQIVALTVALETKSRQESGASEADGFEAEWIRQQALKWWPHGFPDGSYDAFRALLDEMVGLGVLRRAGLDLRAYALRSPTIAGLLGSPGEIEQALLEASEKAPPELYQAAIYRRGRPGDPWVRSPLTGQQESEVLVEKDGVVLLFGTVLAGLEWVAPFLAKMVADKDFVALDLIEAVQDLRGFEGRLGKALDASRKTDGVRLFVVPHTEPWTRAWVHAAATQVARHRSTRITNRVLFVGDSRDAWDWLGSAGADEGRAVSTLALSPWARPFVGQWARDAGFGPLGNEDLALWGEATGWWGGLLAPLGERLKGDPAAWRKVFESFQQQFPETLRGLRSRDVPPELIQPLQVLATYGEPLSEVDWLELLKGPDSTVDREWLGRLIRWADLLSLLAPAEGGAWAIDRVLGQILAE